LTENEELKGEFKNNKLNGMGTFTTSKGDVIRGLWVNGEV
jgi:hypothetical protein